jgi:hypothetical protein
MNNTNNKSQQEIFSTHMEKFLKQKELDKKQKLMMMMQESKLDHDHDHNITKFDISSSNNNNQVANLKFNIAENNNNNLIKEDEKQTIKLDFTKKRYKQIIIDLSN